MTRWVPFLLLAGACAPAAENGPLRVSVIGGPPTLVDPIRRAPDETQRVMLGAVTQGLVGFDAAGQISPALAQRWIVTSDGLSAIFRLGPATWPDGRRVTTTEVARRARALLAPASRNPLRPAFDSIDEIVAVTPEVIEFRLRTPRPPLLELLAQPEATMLSRAGVGTGPFRLLSRQGDTAVLEPRNGGSSGAIMIVGERAARAVARFRAGEAELVLGGTALDWPLVSVAGLQPRSVQLDPAEGLFGLSVVRARGFLGEAANREVLAMAIDRPAMLAAFAAPRWEAALGLLPAPYRSAAAPALPGWAALDQAGRLDTARRRVATWGGEPPLIRVHLPQGPGANLLYARLVADWRRVGLNVARAERHDADVVLVDRVAPAGSAIWYLGTVACPAPAQGACVDEAQAALAAARASQALEDRGTQLALADRAVADSGLWIPIARPLRWSLVSPRLTGFRPNARAWHPLDRLVAVRR